VGNVSAVSHVHAFHESGIHRLICERRLTKGIFMKHFSKCLWIGLISSLCVGQYNSRADLEVSASVQIRTVADFHAPLTPHGAWIEVGSYGRCWRPARVTVGWQPYIDGHWVWTDCGWYWVSDEPWAWACYRYGTWAYDSSHGWIWVPGIEWGPAWVTWRYGGGYCGWAPLAPRGMVIAPRTFVFVEARRFHEPVRRSTVIINNTTIINKTTVVGGIRHETRNISGGAAQKVVVNEGPRVDEIQKATGKKINAVPIREAVVRNPVPTDAVNKINESRKKEKQPDVDKQPGPDKKNSVVETKPDGRSVPQPQPTQPVSPSDKGKVKEDKGPDGKGPDRPDRGLIPPNVAPPPQQSPASGNPSGRPAKQPPGKEKNQNKGKDSGKGKDKN
jgi:hypothetical protein